jgi:hypothetical protein
LDNAKRHSHASEDGTWAIAGFMEARKRSDNSGTHAYFCHLAIISPGRTIYESLQHAPAPTKSHIAAFVNLHKPTLLQNRAYDEEALWTLSALQDTISRASPTEESINGFGMMTLVEMMNELGATRRPEEQPRLTVLSGASCLMIRPPYNVPAKGPNGHRVLALNAANDLKYQPDEAYVFRMPYRFPGTIVTMRFCLDSEEMVRRTKGNGSDA